MGSKTRVVVILLGVALIIGRKRIRQLLTHLFAMRKQPLRTLPWLDETYGGQIVAHVLKEHGVKVGRRKRERAFFVFVLIAYFQRWCSR